MFAKLDYKNIAIIVVVVLFYLRLYMIRGRKIKQDRLETQKAIANRKKKVPASPSSSFYRPRYQVSSWWILGPAIGLCLIGLTVLTTNISPEILKPNYWLFIVAGGILFIFSFK